MATLEQLEDNAKTVLTAASYTVLTSWSTPDAPVVASTASVQVADSERITAGSNLYIRTAELLVRVHGLATDTTAAALAASEALVNADLEELTAGSFWQAVTGVRESPLVTVEVEDEPERIGRVISFTLRVSVALEA